MRGRLRTYRPSRCQQERFFLSSRLLPRRIFLLLFSRLLVRTLGGALVIRALPPLPPWGEPQSPGLSHPSHLGGSLSPLPPLPHLGRSLSHQGSPSPHLGRGGASVPRALPPLPPWGEPQSSGLSLLSHLGGNLSPQGSPSLPALGEPQSPGLSLPSPTLGGPTIPRALPAWVER